MKTWKITAEGTHKPMRMQPRPALERYTHCVGWEGKPDCNAPLPIQRQHAGMCAQCGPAMTAARHPGAPLSPRDMYGVPTMGEAVLASTWRITGQATERYLASSRRGVSSSAQQKRGVQRRLRDSNAIGIAHVGSVRKR